jgi:hypothetical protein
VDQDVEGVINNARLCGAKALEKIEVRPSIGTQGHQLSVDDRVIREILQGGRNVVKPLVQDVSPPRVEGSASTPDDLQPIAVQLDFVGPFRSLGQSGDGEAIHGLNENTGPSFKRSFSLVQFAVEQCLIG